MASSRASSSKFPTAAGYSSTQTSPSGALSTALNGGNKTWDWSKLNAIIGEEQRALSKSGTAPLGAASSSNHSSTKPTRAPNAVWRGWDIRNPDPIVTEQSAKTLASKSVHQATTWKAPDRITMQKSATPQSAINTLASHAAVKSSRADEMNLDTPAPLNPAPAKAKEEVLDEFGLSYDDSDDDAYSFGLPSDDEDEEEEEEEEDEDD